MRIGAGITGMESAMTKRTSREINKKFSDMNSEAASYGNSVWTMNGSRLQERMETEDEETKDSAAEKLASEDENGEPILAHRSEAEKIYQAAVSGKPNPIGSMLEAPKVPYGRLAKDGTIVYNGVSFVCDEKTNSICLGDVTDKEKVLNIPLSGGGHLKVNRDCIGLLSKAVGMFSPEDLNLIMRAISEDTRIQAVQKEIEDEEASIGNQLGESADGAEAGSQITGEKEDDGIAG